MRVGRRSGGLKNTFPAAVDQVGENGREKKKARSFHLTAVASRRIAASGPILSPAAQHKHIKSVLHFAN